MTNKALKITALASLLAFAGILVFVTVKSKNGVSVGQPNFEQENLAPEDSSQSGASMPNQTATTQTKASPAVTASPTPNATPSPTPRVAPKPTPDTRCLITIDGKSYDVTSYRKQHPGGDIFTCGTDMTKVFYSQHGSSTLKKMQKYLVK